MRNDVIDQNLLFDQMPVVRFLVQKQEGQFYCVAMNKMGKDFFGKEQVLAQPLEDLFGVEDFKHVLHAFDVCWNKNLVVTLSNLPESMKTLKSSGFWVNPICDDDGEVICLDVIGQPGTADKAVVERERDDALSLLTSIFDASEVGILVFDKERHIIKMNHSFERIYGWNESETIGKDFVNFVTSDEEHLAKGSYDFFLLNDERHSGEVKIICKGGAIANTMYTTAPLKLSQNRRFQVTTLVDITRWKQINLSLELAKERADSANNAKSAFLANMSHELRTPLNAIIGFSEMMVAEAFGPLGDSKYKEYLSDVHLSAKHLLDVINEVLDMSKIESGKIELDEQEIDLNAIIETLVRVMKSGHLKAAIDLVEDYQSDLPRLYADPRLVRQILINLITNSIKYSVDGGKITVATKLNHKHEIEIIVSDEGVGIPEDRIKDAMEPFGQIHDPHTHSDVYQGTGLGLPLAKAMVEMHGGVFILKSEENKGTTVNISFSKSRTRGH